MSNKLHIWIIEYQFSKDRKPVWKADSEVYYTRAEAQLAIKEDCCHYDGFKTRIVQYVPKDYTWNRIGI